jgi:selT/selW/selH-like putative selenoprotein
MLTTGAFEIFVNGNLEFSRLQSGRFPSGDELIAIMERYDIKL